jgi:hypothetical protein
MANIIYASLLKSFFSQSSCAEKKSKRLPRQCNTEKRMRFKVAGELRQTIIIDLSLGRMEKKQVNLRKESFAENLVLVKREIKHRNRLRRDFMKTRIIREWIKGWKSLSQVASRLNFHNSRDELHGVFGMETHALVSAPHC